MKEVIIFTSCKEAKTVLEDYLEDLIERKGKVYVAIPLKENGVTILVSIFTYLHITNYRDKVGIWVDGERVRTFSDIFKVNGGLKII